jgi:ABC-type sugar transport system ATPase subunit
MSATPTATAGARRTEISTPPGGPLLDAHDLAKSFGAVQALRGASLTVKRGEVAALVGDNGSGKSTLIRCVSGVYRPDRGVIRFDDHEVRFHSPEAARRLGIETVYQDLALVEDLTVWQNMFLNREVRRGPLLNKRAMIRRADDTLADLGVDVASAKATVRRLSGGQRQAVAITRAIAWGSALVIMDEPTAALGVRETASVERLIARLRDEGLTTLIISHDLEQVLRVADEIWVMRQGRVAGVRRTKDVRGEDIVALITGVADEGEGEGEGS